jgi:cadmium resistance protein CadD (predicted permease)
VESVAGTVLAAAAAFAATNLDDLVLLAAFFADRSYRPRAVVAGQYAGIGLLYAASLAAAQAALVIPHDYLALLGVLPIAIGVRKLRAASDGDTQIPHTGTMASVAAVTLANGGDNIAVYVPLLVTRPLGDMLLIGGVFFAMTALWCYCALHLVTRPDWGRATRAKGHRLVPWVLIALGLWILLGGT